jgi:hypothetical protein
MNGFFDMMDSLGKMMNPTETPEHNYTPLEDAYVEQLKAMAVNFEQRSLLGGLQYTAYFKNGYGIDIVKHNASYGRENDLWEIAVMKDGRCNYDTVITDDVIGWLTSEEVMHYATRVKMLKGE